jgi:hypothetical protein
MTYTAINNIQPALKGKYVRFKSLHLTTDINRKQLKIEPGSIGLIYSVQGFGKMFVGLNRDMKQRPAQTALLTSKFEFFIEIYSDQLSKLELEN